MQLSSLHFRILVAFSLERLAVFRFQSPKRVAKGHRRSTLILVSTLALVAGVTTSGTLVWYYHWWTNRHQETYSQPEWVAQWIRLRQKIDVSLPFRVRVRVRVRVLKKEGVFRFSDCIPDPGCSQSSADQSVLADLPETSNQNRQAFDSGGQKKARQPPVLNLTRMLLGCVAIYFGTQFPAVILNTLDHLSYAPHCLFHLKYRLDWEAVISTLALVNYSANFFVYVGISKRYRAAAKASIRRR
jgi:hypothetical protein